MQTTVSRRTILRKPAMKRRTGDFNDTTYQRWESQGLFPKRIQIGPNCVGWYEDEIDAWAASRVRAVESQTEPRPSPNPKAHRAAAATEG